jgi:hypothetical protein
MGGMGLSLGQSAGTPGGSVVRGVVVGAAVVGAAVVVGGLVVVGAPVVGAAVEGAGFVVALVGGGAESGEAGRVTNDAAGAAAPCPPDA